MTEKQEYAPIEPAPDDTQRLLRGVKTPPEGAFRLEDILEEFGGEQEDGPASPPQPQPTPEPDPVPEPEPVPEPAAPLPGSDPADPLEDSGELPEGLMDGLLEEELWEELLPGGGEENDGVPTPDEPAGEVSRRRGRAADRTPEPPKSAVPPVRRPVQQPAKSPPPKPKAKPAPPQPVQGIPLEEETAAGEMSMEDIVASTVDAVKEQQARRQEQFRRQLEKIRKKADREGGKKHAPVRRSPPEAAENEAPYGETAGWHRRRYKLCRGCLIAAVPVLALLWLPWVLAQMGIELPFFSASTDNAALCVLVPQAVLCLLCWPVFRGALEGLREGAWTFNAAALLATLATLLDEMTLLLLPQRSDVAPMGGVAATVTVFCLWGMTGYHRGMAETLRTAAMGAPSRLADCCEAGIAKGAGSLKGFSARLNMEDAAGQWQRLLLPLLVVAAVIFALLSSVGQGRGQNLLWCASVILCAATSLVYPLAYCVPFGRVAARLARVGAAVAGHYGASILSADPRLVVTDGDLFPQGAAALNGMKPYGEERERAISYAATLAVQGGGLLGRLFEDLCRSESIEYQPLEHFHIHDDSGLSGMIHGETVLVGTAAFMRHMAVRLPAALPGKTPVCLAVDGALTAVFAVKYTAADSVSAAVNALRRNGLQLSLAVRDGNMTPKLLRARFGADGGAVMLELNERLSFSDPEREAGGPNGILYRDGLLPFVSLVAGSRRLCQTVLAGNLLSVLGSVSGVLLGFYLTFAGSYNVLTPVLLMTYLLLWTAPMAPLVWGVDKL